MFAYYSSLITRLHKVISRKPAAPRIMVTYTQPEALTLIPRDTSAGKRELITGTDIAKTREIINANRTAACPANPAFFTVACH